MYKNIYVKRSYGADADTVWLWDDKKGMVTFPYTPYAYVRATPINSKGKKIYKSIYGDELIRTTEFNHNDTNLFESDVPPATRILVDEYYQSDVPSEGIITMMFDIEVEMIGQPPDPKLGNNPITSIAFHISSTDEFFVLVLDQRERVTAGKQGNRTILPFKDERKLLLQFIKYIHQYTPDIMSGWNVDVFDIPYLYNRIKRLLGASAAKQLSVIGEVFYSKHRERYTIAGASVLDYMVIYKKFSTKELPSYSLNFVSMYELNRGKIEYDGNLDDLMENDIDTFIEYNITDVQLVMDLDKKLQFIDLLRGVCHIGHVPYEDFVYSSKYLEGALLVQLKKEGRVAPNKSLDSKQKMQELKDNNEVGFVGAYVKDPIPGIYPWMYDLDLTSLYPSIIMTLGISPETKLGKIQDWDADEFNRAERETYIINGKEVPRENVKKLFDSKMCSVASNGVLYRTDIVGLIPFILNDWAIKRTEYKDEMTRWGLLGDKAQYAFYKQRQLAQKTILNSLYGVLGLPIFRFYDVDNAEAVTLSGQTVITKTEATINEKYNTELGTIGKDYIQYIDTDSVFVSSLPLVKNRYPDIDTNDETIMTEKIYQIASEVQKYVNDFYDVFSLNTFNVEKHRLQIKQEMIGRSGFWVKKKRYAMWIISDNGVPCNHMEIKGLDIVRSSFPKAFQNFMREILNDILKYVDKKIIDEKILNFKNNLTKILYVDIAKNTSVKDIAKYESPIQNEPLGTYIKGTPAHVKSAINYNKLIDLFKCSAKYTKIKNGEKVKFVYLNTNPYGISQIAFRGDGDPDEILSFINQYISVDKLFYSELDKKLKTFYDALGWTFPSESNKNLSKFFNFK
ncbi:PolB DNA polymerase elongation subunit [Microcystis phage Mel-JY01]